MGIDGNQNRLALPGGGCFGKVKKPLERWSRWFTIFTWEDLRFPTSQPGGTDTWGKNQAFNHWTLSFTGTEKRHFSSFGCKKRGAFWLWTSKVWPLRGGCFEVFNPGYRWQIFIQLLRKKNTTWSNLNSQKSEWICCSVFRAIILQLSSAAWLYLLLRALQLGSGNWNGDDVFFLTEKLPTFFRFVWKVLPLCLSCKKIFLYCLQSESLGTA